MPSCDPKHLGLTYFSHNGHIVCEHCDPESLAPKGANSTQVGGSHYENQIQHWDFAASQQFDYFQGQITKYVTRWKKKNGLEDLEKAKHFLDKYIELNTPKG